MLKKLTAYNQLLPLLGDSSLPKVTLAMIIAGCMGFSVRLAYEWGKNTITFKTSVIRLIFSVCLSYFSLFIWMDYNIKHNVIYWIAGFCLMSMEVVYEAVKLIEMGLKGYLQNLFRKFLAKDEQV